MASPEFDAQATAQQFFTTWKRVVFDAGGFFAEMPETGGLQAPLVFLAVCEAIHWVGAFLLCFSVRALVGGFVLGMATVGVFAAVVVLVAQHLFNGRAGFESTFRVIAYSAAPLVLAWVPRLGVLAVLYTLFLAVRGIERVQGFDATRAVLTVVIAAVTLLVVGHALGGGPRHLG